MTATRTLLVADDDHLIVQTLCDALSLHGWNTRTANSAEDAFALTCRERFHCVLMDIRMEGQDGFSALQKIKRRNHALPVILMTAYTPEELIAEAERKGNLQNRSTIAAPGQLARELAQTCQSGKRIMALGLNTSLLREVATHSALEGLSVQQFAWNDDFVAAFESDTHAVTLVTVEVPERNESGFLLVTDFDAGVWATLTGLSRLLPPIPHCSIKNANRLLRKPFAIPSLIEQLDAILAA